MKKKMTKAEKRKLAKLREERSCTLSTRQERVIGLSKSLHTLMSLPEGPKDNKDVVIKRNARQKLTGRNYEELNIISKAKPKGRKFKEYTLEELKILNDKREELCKGGKSVALKDLIKATNL